MSGQEQCPKCHQLNSCERLICEFCGARLPWAGELEEARRKRLAVEELEAEDRRQSQFAARKCRKAGKDEVGDCWICANCGHIGGAQKYQKGSDWFACVLALAFILPGLIYFMWNAGTKYKGCASCCSKDIVRVDSPKGQMLMRQYYPSGHSEL